MIRALEAAVLAWLMFNGALFVSLSFEDALQLSRSTMDRFKRAIGAMRSPDRGDGLRTKELVGRFVQTLFGTAVIYGNVTDQFTSEFVDVSTSEAIDLPAAAVEN
jgi:hypothetical protein